MLASKSLNSISPIFSPSLLRLCYLSIKYESTLITTPTARCYKLNLSFSCWTRFRPNLVFFNKNKSVIKNKRTITLHTIERYIAPLKEVNIAPGINKMAFGTVSLSAIFVDIFIFSILRLTKKLPSSSYWSSFIPITAPSIILKIPLLYLLSKVVSLIFFWNS